MQKKTTKAKKTTIVNQPETKPIEKTRTLLEIGEDYSELEVLLEAAGGEISPEQEKQIEEYFANLGEERDKKIEGYCSYIRNLEMLGNKRADEAKRIAALGKTDLNRAEYLKSKLLGFMKLHKFTNIDTLRYKLTRAENASAPVLLDREFAENPEKLEDRLRTVSYKPNLKEIAQALADGEKLGFAKWGEKGENLRIR